MPPRTPSLPTRLGRRLRAVARAARGARPVIGVVDEVTRDQLAGWVWLPDGADPVQVQLVVGDLVVTSTHTMPQTARREQPSARARARRRARREWRAEVFPPPPGSRRRAASGQIHTFVFRLNEVWDYTRRSTRVSVLLDGQPLPVAGHGFFVTPPVDGQSSLDELRDLIARGHVLNQRGRLILARPLDDDWRRAVTRLHARVHALLAAERGLETFLAYGTLLGAVREGGPIAHDDDLDVGYLSTRRDGPAVAEELLDVARALIEGGLAVEAGPAHLHVREPDDPVHKIDLGPCYFDEDGEIAFPFGVAGTSSFTEADWEGLRPTTFLGEQVLVPAAAEKLLAHVYGDDWRRPRPGFQWRRARVKAATDARLGVEERIRVHWATYWADYWTDSEHGRRREDPSPLAERVLAREHLPRTVLEIGCGDGLDACLLGSRGLRVVGLDAEPAAVERAVGRARERGLEERVGFAVCDVGEEGALRRHLEELRQEAQGPMTFYLRFFLHAVTQRVHDVVLETLADCGEEGDVLVAEFRTTGDEPAEKAPAEHFRRYLDAERFRKDLEEQHGFEVDHLEEGRGLSPYGDEDPVLCRVVAHRRAP